MQTIQGQIIQQPGGGTYLIQGGTMDGEGTPLTHTTRASPATVCVCSPWGEKDQVNEIHLVHVFLFNLDVDLYIVTCKDILPSFSAYKALQYIRRTPNL